MIGRCVVMDEEVVALDKERRADGSELLEDDVFSSGIVTWFSSTMGSSVVSVDYNAGFVVLSSFKIDIASVVYLYHHRRSLDTQVLVSQWLDYVGRLRVVGVTESLPTFLFWHCEPASRVSDSWFLEAMRLRKVYEEAHAEYCSFLDTRVHG